MPTTGFRLFKLFGITVYLNWSWIVVAIIEMKYRTNIYHWFGWNVLEYLALFAIVLMHEFGHALACKSVGGKADRIVLWPFGGVAYVQPPLRPGAMLWSIVAGPLVNVILIPFTLGLAWLKLGSDDCVLFAQQLAEINLVLLIFNILPIYPLDGGKILWSLLWFPMGMGRALMIASIVGLIGTAGLAILAILSVNYWLILLTLFAGSQAWRGFQSAREIRRRENIRLRPNAACPACGAHPPIGPYWACSTCGARFDAFDHPDACPGCRKPHQWNTCLSCGTRAPFAAWSAGIPAPHAPAPAFIPSPGTPGEG
jgi:Zn-dependent protease